MSTRTSPATKSASSFLWRWTRRVLLGGIGLVALYVLAALALSRIPVNRDFVQPDDGIEIAILSNGVHVDIALPLHNEHFEWMTYLRTEDVVQFDPDTRFASFGWGERTFYLETPTWADVNPKNVLRAFCGAGRPVMHVDFLSWTPTSSGSCRLIKLSTQQYKRLCAEILATMKTCPNGKLLPIAGAHYHNYDAFYEATGHYHVFHTCNAWAGDVLRASGVRVGIWTPTTDGVFACLPGS
jgi:uncharacterized protein (TIGR02117 family)